MKDKKQRNPGRVVETFTYIDPNSPWWRTIWRERKAFLRLDDDGFVVADFEAYEKEHADDVLAEPDKKE